MTVQQVEIFDAADHVGGGRPAMLAALLLGCAGAGAWECRRQCRSAARPWKRHASHAT